MDLAIRIEYVFSFFPWHPQQQPAPGGEVYIGFGIFNTQKSI